MDERLVKFLAEIAADMAAACAALTGELLGGPHGRPSIAMPPDVQERLLSAAARAQELLDELGGGGETEPAEEPLDPRCPEDVRCWLRGIAEQTAKRQYWNAAYRTYQLLGEFLKAFGAVLHNKPDHFGHEPPSRSDRPGGG